MCTLYSATVLSHGKAPVLVCGIVRPAPACVTWFQVAGGNMCPVVCVSPARCCRHLNLSCLSGLDQAGDMQAGCKSCSVATAATHTVGAAGTGVGGEAGAGGRSAGLPAWCVCKVMASRGMSPVRSCTPHMQALCPICDNCSAAGVASGYVLALSCCNAASLCLLVTWGALVVDLDPAHAHARPATPDHTSDLI